MDAQTEKDWSFETNVYVTLLREEIEELKELLKQKEDENRELVDCLQETLNEVGKFHDDYPDFAIKGQALISRLSAKLGK